MTTDFDTSLDGVIVREPRTWANFGHAFLIISGSSPYSNSYSANILNSEFFQKANIPKRILLTIFDFQITMLISKRFLYFQLTRFPMNVSKQHIAESTWKHHYLWGC